MLRSALEQEQKKWSEVFSHSIDRLPLFRESCDGGVAEVVMLLPLVCLWYYAHAVFGSSQLLIAGGAPVAEAQARWRQGLRSGVDSLPIDVILHST